MEELSKKAYTIRRGMETKSIQELKENLDGSTIGEKGAEVNISAATSSGQERLKVFNPITDGVEGHFQVKHRGLLDPPLYKGPRGSQT